MLPLAKKKGEVTCCRKPFLTRKISTSLEEVNLVNDSVNSGYLSLRSRSPNFAILYGGNMETVPAVKDARIEVAEIVNESTENPPPTMFNQRKKSFRRTLGRNRGVSGCPSIRGVFG